MKKKNNNKLFNIIFFMFLLSFIIVYFSQITGYYQYQNYKKSELTKEQIKQFESDIKNGKKVDLSQYLANSNTTYDNKLSKFTSKVSDGISNVVKKIVESTFKYISKLVDE